MYACVYLEEECTVTGVMMGNGGAVTTQSRVALG